MLKKALAVVKQKFSSYLLTKFQVKQLHKKGILKLHFVDDYYIYKNIDNGYSVLYGEMNYGGEKIPFHNFNQDTKQMPNHFLCVLHSFDWLQDIKLVENEAATACIFDLFNTWINNYQHQVESVAFDKDILASRIFNWITSGKTLKFASLEFENAFYQSISLQIRLLIKTFKDGNYKIGTSPYKTLFAISLATESNNLYKLSISELIKYLDKSFLPDGGHIAKCPYITFNNLCDLIFIYKNLATPSSSEKTIIRGYIDRITVFIKSIRYKDGGLALFYQGYEEQAQKIYFILSLSNLNAKSFKLLRYSGYLNLEGENNYLSTLIRLPEKTDKSNFKVYDNSILSQEVSINKSRIFVNNTSYNPYFKPSDKLPLLPRYNYSSMIFFKNQSIINMPAKLNEFDCRTEHRVDNLWNTMTSNYCGLKKSHDLIWHKSIYLEKHNKCILGEDLITINKNNPYKLSGILRFIIHPGVSIKRPKDSLTSLCFFIDGKEWVFKSTAEINVIDSIYSGIKGEYIPNKIIDLALPFKKENNVVEWALIQSE